MHMMPLHVCVKERLANVQRSCPQVFLNDSNGVDSKMMAILQGKELSASC